MLKAFYHKDFKKDFNKLSKNMKTRFAERFLIFLKNPTDPILRDHSLVGDLRGKRAFSVAGNVRVVYRVLNQGTVFLLRIGTHNQVY